jgi:hypothetical protein
LPTLDSLMTEELAKAYQEANDEIDHTFDACAEDGLALESSKFPNSYSVGVKRRGYQDLYRFHRLALLERRLLIACLGHLNHPL